MVIQYFIIRRYGKQSSITYSKVLAGLSPAGTVLYPVTAAEQMVPLPQGKYENNS